MNNRVRVAIGAAVVGAAGLGMSGMALAGTSYDDGHSSSAGHVATSATHDDGGEGRTGLVGGVLEGVGGLLGGVWEAAGPVVDGLL
ncbi:hypothetical protein [Pseudonocardia sp. KRD291]|uniref:hypothetical protein n=1 Tax=Pseudonocardia sp. KRD291 TaxID=2792007 RepID=UPI001C4A554A|nr:hypothetical protein [Pseudonocardia sp. KRD291]MBW0101834.1 hypothetical protein [Pseudonocardia sp. KRD291]